MRILIAVDVTDADAEDFVRRAARLAQGLGDTADLIYVDEAADENPWIGDEQLRAMMSTHYDAWHQGLHDRLARLLVEAVPEGVRGAVHVVRGQAAPVLLEQVADYDVLIVGNRPTTGLARLAHGVVAERVMRQSDKPVLVLPRA
jgi:nucleotide-binding universal stress UspA family protein